MTAPRLSFLSSCPARLSVLSGLLAAPTRPSTSISRAAPARRARLSGQVDMAAPDRLPIVAAWPRLSCPALLARLLDCSPRRAIAPVWPLAAGLAAGLGAGLGACGLPTAMPGRPQAVGFQGLFGPLRPAYPLRVLPPGGCRPRVRRSALFGWVLAARVRPIDFCPGSDARVRPDRKSHKRLKAIRGAEDGCQKPHAQAGRNRQKREAHR